jgi:hypothetical protein
MQLQSDIAAAAFCSSPPNTTAQFPAFSKTRSTIPLAGLDEPLRRVGNSYMCPDFKFCSCT